MIFLVAGGVLVAAATVLATAADGISEATGIGRVWVGAVLIAGATSLPELATDVAAVRMGAPDLAAGDLFGSGMANMLLLAFVDLALGRRSLLRRASTDNTLAAGLAIILNAAAAAFILLRPELEIARIGPASLALVVIYVLGTRAIYEQGRRAGADAASHNAAPAPVQLAPLSPQPQPQPQPSPPPPQQQQPKPKLRPALIRFLVAALVIVITAPLLASSAKDFADASGLGTTFVGTVLVGLVTSLPELVAAIVAVRIGALDLAVGNLFGSNAFNMVIFFAMDIAAPGAIFAALSPAHTMAALLSVILMGLGLAAIVYRAESRFALAEPSSAIMIIVYGAGIAMLYAHATMPP